MAGHTSVSTWGMLTTILLLMLPCMAGHTSVSTWGMLTAILLLQFRLKVPTLGVQLVQVRISLFIKSAQ